MHFLKAECLVILLYLTEKRKEWSRTHVIAVSHVSEFLLLLVPDRQGEEPWLCLCKQWRAGPARRE